MHPDPHISRNETPVLSPSAVITPTKSKSRGLLADLAGWPSYSDMRIQLPAPGSENAGGLHQSSTLTSETPSTIAPTLGAIQKSNHLPTPQSPGNVASYLLMRTPTSSQNSLQPDHELNALPTEFRSHMSSSPPPFRPHSIPTPDPSPLVARSRNNAPHVLSQLVRTDSHDDNNLLSRAPTPLRTDSRQASTRPVTPVLQSRPTTTPLHWRLPESSHFNYLNSNDTAISPLPQKVKDEPGIDTVRIGDQLIENDFATTQGESRRPDYFKRMRRLAPSSSTGAGGASSAPSDLGSKDGSLIWSSANMGVIDCPNKGKRIALFQETSEESFEESLMAGGYGRYRSDKPSSWKLEEVPNQLGDATGEAELGSEIVLTEEEKRKRNRLAAFLNPSRVSSSAPLLPIEIEGRGRVLMKIEPSEPQTPPKPTPKAKRSRKRKKMSADVKHGVDVDGIAAPEVHAVDGPNWPDTEFPWRFRLMASDGLSSMEQEERMRYIESFLDRESDEDDTEEGHSSSGRHTPDVPPRSPRSGGGKMFPLYSHSKDRGRSSVLGDIPNDPADAKTALLCKKSIQAVQLRLLRRRNTYRHSDSDDGEPLCICQGRDDGRPLVQCDACRTWYHLECIGIQSMSELGKEEDPWFCANCAEVKTPPPVVLPLSEPTFAPSEDGEGDVSYDPFLMAGLNPSPATPWTRRTPPRVQHTPHGTFGSSWDEPPSSSSRGDPRTPTTSAFGDTVRVYGMTAGRTEPSLTDGFDPTSTPSRGIMFGLPFMTPKEGRWGMGSHGARSGGQELFHTPKRPGEDGSAASVRQQYHARVGEVSEGPSGVQGLFRVTGPNNVTPVEREGPKRVHHVLESPLGAKRSRRRIEP